VHESSARRACARLIFVFTAVLRGLKIEAAGSGISAQSLPQATPSACLYA